MKTLVLCTRDDEREFIARYAKDFSLDVTVSDCGLNQSAVELISGHKAVCFLGGSPIDEDLIRTMSEKGVEILATRSAGFNNIDLNAAKKCGIVVSNVPAYSPNSVSEYTVGVAIALCRNFSAVFNRVNIHDYTIHGLRGREIRKSTIGVIGVGKIGFEVAKSFKGMGAEVLATDVYHRDDTEGILKYVTLDELLAQSDIITIHSPLLDNNYHLIDKDAIFKMKTGALLINAARGPLVDAEAVLYALLNDKLGGFAMDTYEYESGIFSRNRNLKTIDDKVFLALHSLNNVIITPHLAFYTDEAVKNMVEGAFENIYQFANNLAMNSRIA